MALSAPAESDCYQPSSNSSLPQLSDSSLPIPTRQVSHTSSSSSLTESQISEEMEDTPETMQDAKDWGKLADRVAERVSKNLETQLLPSLFARHFEELQRCIHDAVKKQASLPGRQHVLSKPIPVREMMKSHPEEKPDVGMSRRSSSSSARGSLQTLDTPPSRDRTLDIIPVLPKLPEGASCSLKGSSSGVSRNSWHGQSSPKSPKSHAHAGLGRRMEALADNHYESEGIRGEDSLEKVSSRENIAAPKSRARRMSVTVKHLEADIAGFLLADLAVGARTPTLSELTPPRYNSEFTDEALWGQDWSPASSRRTSTTSSKVAHLPAETSGRRMSNISKASGWSALSQQTPVSLTVLPKLTMSSLRMRSQQRVMDEEMGSSKHIEAYEKVRFDHQLIPLRISGIIPWRSLSDTPSTCIHTLCISYQWLVLTLGLLGCLTTILPLTQRPSRDSMDSMCYSETTCLRIGLFSDLPVAFGAFLGLLSLGTQISSPEMIESLQMLRCYAYREDFEARWQALSRWEVVAAVVLWLWIVGERARGIGAVKAALDASLDGPTTLNMVLFASSSLFLVTLTFLVSLISHGLASAVDSFCAGLINSGDLSRAIHRWNVVSAMLRTASGTIQSCLFVLQLTVLFTFLLGAVDLYLSTQQQNGIAILLMPHALLTVGISRVFFRAAAVSEKCARVPSLINACNFGEPFDESRQYVVQYVEQSAAGFYVRDIRLTAAMTMKFSYVCFLGFFTLCTQILSDQ